MLNFSIETHLNLYLISSHLLCSVGSPSSGLETGCFTLRILCLPSNVNFNINSKISAGGAMVWKVFSPRAHIFEGSAPREMLTGTWQGLVDGLQVIGQLLRGTVGSWSFPRSFSDPSSEVRGFVLGSASVLLWCNQLWLQPLELSLHSPFLSTRYNL